jgi:hypothetical protein
LRDAAPAPARHQYADLEAIVRPFRHWPKAKPSTARSLLDRPQ